ncbi:O-glucosyltransferase rumi-like protein [Thalictrum thalictroides]|uniref:O-glucosyltransferase rumi-like protein n=1 Tax=Thalictrum thalictroides TaxID=46969 RepID=A0A7J6WX72_THATH|nr:O-glucosyltransferase rumi-like protein [Thalictrum thalictroides]
MLNEYSKLLKFKPSIPEKAVEICPETMACRAEGLKRKFMMESMVGVLIEEPFPNLALDEICKQIRDSIQEAFTIENAIKGQLQAKQKIYADKHPNGRPNS